MKFGAVPTDQAEGAILAHGITLAHHLPDQKGRKIAKGTPLTPQHISDLIANGVHTVVVARLESGDVHENAAAQQLARALVHEGDKGGVQFTAASTGRVNLRAAHAGIVDIHAEAIHAVNRVDPAITVATVPLWRKVGAGGLIATIKIIPYAVRECLLKRACRAAVGAIALQGPHIADASLIETQVKNDVPPEKGRRAMRARVGHFGVHLSPRIVVPHRTDDIAHALRTAPGALLMILTGSATSDAHDVAPQAVRRAGGRVIHYGMPVDPGNLLFLGELEDKPVIGLPGCARSSALNGADWVLERVICGVDVTGTDIMAMGVGGLLKEIPTRPQPRTQADKQ